MLNVTDTFAVTQNLCNSSNWRSVWPDVLKDRPMAEELKVCCATYCVYFCIAFVEVQSANVSPRQPLQEKLGPTRPDLFPDYKEWLAARKAAAEAAAAAAAAAEADGAKKTKKKNKKKKAKNGAKKAEGKK